MKSKRIRILYICFNLSSLVRRYFDILNKHFEVRFVLFLYSLLKEIRKTDVVFSRFASTHAFFAVLFSKIFKKRSVVIVAGFDVANIPEIDYGFARSTIARFLLRFTLNNTDKVLPLSNALKRDIFSIGGIKGDNIKLPFKDEILGEILVGKRRTWAKTYYLPCFIIRRLLSKYFNSVKIRGGETFDFLCEEKRRGIKND